MFLGVNIVHTVDWVRCCRWVPSLSCPCAPSSGLHRTAFFHLSLTRSWAQQRKSWTNQFPGSERDAEVRGVLWGCFIPVCALPLPFWVNSLCLSVCLFFSQIFCTTMSSFFLHLCLPGWICTGDCRSCFLPTQLPTGHFDLLLVLLGFLLRAVANLHLPDCLVLFVSGARSLMCPLRKSTTRPSGTNSGGLLTWQQLISSFDDNLHVRC